MISSIITTIIAVLITISLCFLYFRIKMRQQIQHYEQQVSELKDIAWRAQMNPHFLNNCLNNINSFIHKLDKETASNYLTCLSRLMRKTLEYSDQSKITLAQELHAVANYIKLEQLRFGTDIDIKISVEEQLSAENIQVLPFFIQPFLENAILHGVLPKQNKGNITIQITTPAPHILSCSVTDDGVGRKKPNQSSEEPTAAKRSMGMSITCKRIELFNRTYGQSLPLTIHDLTDQNGSGTGTSVEIKLALVSDDLNIG
jgi:LytS/YehU family sensor histidine kinase